MKSMLTILLSSCIGIAGYAQSSAATPKHIQGHKNNSILATQKNNNSTIASNSCNSKNGGQNNINAAKPEFSIISIIPTLRLWLLPGNFPNPFSKEDD